MGKSSFERRAITQPIVVRDFPKKTNVFKSKMSAYLGAVQRLNERPTIAYHHRSRSFSRLFGKRNSNGSSRSLSSDFSPPSPGKSALQYARRKSSDVVRLSRSIRNIFNTSGGPGLEDDDLYDDFEVMEPIDLNDLSSTATPNEYPQPSEIVEIETPEMEEQVVDENPIDDNSAVDDAVDSVVGTGSEIDELLEYQMEFLDDEPVENVDSEEDELSDRSQLARTLSIRSDTIDQVKRRTSKIEKVERDAETAVKNLGAIDTTNSKKGRRFHIKIKRNGRARKFRLKFDHDLATCDDQVLQEKIDQIQNDTEFNRCFTVYNRGPLEPKVKEIVQDEWDDPLLENGFDLDDLACPILVTRVMGADKELAAIVEEDEEEEEDSVEVESSWGSTFEDHSSCTGSSYTDLSFEDDNSSLLDMMEPDSSSLVSVDDDDDNSSLVDTGEEDASSIVDTTEEKEEPIDPFDGKIDFDADDDEQSIPVLGWDRWWNWYSTTQKSKEDVTADEEPEDESVEEDVSSPRRLSRSFYSEQIDDIDVPMSVCFVTHPNSLLLDEDEQNQLRQELWNEAYEEPQPQNDYHSADEEEPNEQVSDAEEQVQTRGHYRDPSKESMDDEKTTEYSFPSTSKILHHSYRADSGSSTSLSSMESSDSGTAPRRKKSVRFAAEIVHSVKIYPPEDFETSSEGSYIADDYKWDENPLYGTEEYGNDGWV